MFVTASKMYALEEAVFATGIPAEDLMDRAGLGIARELMRRFPHFSRNLAVAVTGKGNNGADSLVALKHLRDAGWEVAVRSAVDPASLSGLPLKKWQALGETTLLDDLSSLQTSRRIFLLDGLLGIGTEGLIRDPLASLAREMNDLRQSGRATTIAIDVPSGLDCDTGSSSDDSVMADLTCTLGSPKQGLVADQAINHVGSLALLPLPGLSNFDLQQDHLIHPATLPVPALTRPFDFHKGNAGRIGIVAGSRGLAGAAALTSLGALRAGGGLITLFVKKSDYPFILPLVPVEVMVRPIESYREVLEARIDALAIGPGLGDCDHEILSLIQQFSGPAVVDADALNLIARRGSLSRIPSRHILTPHPGEMERLLPGVKGSRKDIALEFVKRCPATLLYKGARTIVTGRDHPIAYNTTGTPGMATGGQGDVLTGVIAALIARGLNGFNAAKLGAWLTGRASEIALGSDSPESLSATTTAHHLGAAFQDLRLTPVT